MALTALAVGVAFGKAAPSATVQTATDASQVPPSSTPSNAPPIAPNDTGGPTTEKPSTVNEIVVTGTLLRNVAPAGAETITLDQTAIAATNAISTDQLLATIPQLSSFGSLPTGNNGGTQLTVNRTNIRNLPQGVGGGSPTLVLMDGHRLVGEGVSQSYPDPDIIPPALIQRVDVVTDGGSATYGSDAIGGVVNFITKKDFDGFDIGARQGIGIDYYSTDIDATGGKVWDGGGFYAGYTYSDHSPLFGYDRGYVKNIDYTTGLPLYTFCNPGNVIVGKTNYAANSGNPLQASNANLCDNAKEAAFYPDEHRSSLLAGFHQKLADNIDFQVKGYYSRRRDLQDGGPITGSGQLTAATPGYIPAAGQSPTAAETADFNFQGVTDGSQAVSTKLESWGITPTLTWKIGHDWQATGYYNYGGSKTTVNNPQVNQTLLASEIGAGTVNPYNIAASSPAALAQALDYTQFGIGEDELQNGKIVFDGPVFRLPGGEIRAALGGEYISERFESTTDTDTDENVAIAPRNYASRSVKAGFGEVNVPIIGPQNNIPFIYSFTLAGAERYDNYSDFGGNWAPNVGGTFKPVSWISLRARYNKAFQAPSLVQLAAAKAPTVGVFPNNFLQFDQALVDPSFPNNGGSIVAEQGTVSPLQPERAKDYNLGFDVSPPMVKGLNVHFTYFNIDYSGQIGTPPLGFGTFFGIPTFDALLMTNPSSAQLSAFLGQRGVSAATIANTIASVNALGGASYYVVDDRSLNLGISKVDGFDIAGDYHHDVPFGSVFANFNSSYTRNATNAADGVTFTGNQAGVDTPRFTSATVFGATVGDHFRGQITWNHLGGFTLTTPVQLGQSSVGSFDTFDAYLQYDFKRRELPPITLSLGVTNLANTDPPIYRADSTSFGAGYANGATLGRVFQLGANVKF